MFRSLILLAVLIGLAASQDVYGVPDKLLADVNPGPDSSNPGTWYIIESAGKAYTSVTITGKIFRQIVVTDGTTAGTKLLQEINTLNRGDPKIKDPFWDSAKDSPIQFYTFGGILWVSLYNYNISTWDIYTVDPATDILRKYEGGIIKDVDRLYETKWLNIQDVGIFKGQYFAFNPDAVDHGLYFFDKAFTSANVFNNATNFKIIHDPNDPFTGFDKTSSVYYNTDDFLIIEGWVQNYGGLWAFDGTNVWPLNLGSQKFHDSLKYFDSVNNKLFYIAFFNDLPQLVVNDLNDLTSNYTILTNLQQDCFPLYDCFSYLSAMDEQKGTVAFAYNTQLGFSDGTLAGTTFWVESPRAYKVHGAYNGKLYYSDYVDMSTAGTLMVTDGTKESVKVAIEQGQVVSSPFIYFNGNAFFTTTVQFWRIDSSDKITLIRETSFSDEFARVTLANNNKQLYLYFQSTQSCGRNCPTKKNFWIDVTDGNGIVRFTDNFEIESLQAVFLNNKFLMSATTPSTGIEIYYMDVAPESYQTPPPEPSSSVTPGSGTSDGSRFMSSLFCALSFSLVFYLLL